MEAETDSSKETTKTDQQIVKPLPKPKAVKPKPEKSKQTTQLKCGCAKTYISQSKLYNHVLERHSNLIVEIVKYESYKRTTSEYVRSRKSVNDKLVPILSKRKPNSAHINESSEHSSTDEEDQETETLLELVMEISKFLDQLREIDSLASALGPSKLAPVFRNGSFGPFKTFTDVEKPDSKNMLLENLTGQNRAKVVPILMQ